jgi:hypothetical protein
MTATPKYRSVQVELLELAAAKAAAKEAAQRVVASEARLIEAMHKAGQKTVSAVLADGEAVKGTLVEPQSVVIDEERLKKAVGASMWKKVTKTVLDKTKLEAAVAIGEIDQNTVAAVSTLKDIKASVRVSGTFNPAEVAKTLAEVTIRDASGRVKPAAKRLVKPKR